MGLRFPHRFLVPWSRSGCIWWGEIDGESTLFSLCFHHFGKFLAFVFLDIYIWDPIQASKLVVLKLGASSFTIYRIWIIDWTDESMKCLINVNILLQLSGQPQNKYIRESNLVTYRYLMLNVYITSLLSLQNRRFGYGIKEVDRHNHNDVCRNLYTTHSDNY